MIAALILVVYLAVVGATCWLALHAPLGFEDERGFHTARHDEFDDPDHWGV